MIEPSELRLIVKVAALYYENGFQQNEIAKKLDLSQATISRLLRRARDEKIIQISVNNQVGVYSDLEIKIQSEYKLKEVIIADSMDESEEEILRSIGKAAAYYLESTIKSNDVLGISSWSSTLLAMVNQMHPLQNGRSNCVVQILGGIGNPTAEKHATHLTSRLAELIKGTPKFLPAPGIVKNVETKKIYLEDPFVKEAFNIFDKINVALVGIGDVEPSLLLQSSGNIFSQKELKNLRHLGAEGDICLRFINQDGRLIKTPLNDLVIGISLEKLKNTTRAIGIAGGKRKVKAIKAALMGKWINVLITDNFTAKKLL